MLLVIQTGGSKNNNHDIVIRHIRAIQHLLPYKCMIKIYYEEIRIITDCTPDRHHDLYYNLKKAGLLDGFIAYGEFKLQQCKKLPAPESPIPYLQLIYSRSITPPPTLKGHTLLN